MSESKRLLYLSGGMGVYRAFLEAFLPACGGEKAALAILLQGGPKTKQHLPDYTRPLEELGLRRTMIIAPEDEQTLDEGLVTAVLRNATGIFIGGGSTAVYHNLYAREPFRSLIRECYQAGIPYAGLSAGALLAMDQCVFTGEDEPVAEPLVIPGLGLLPETLLGVHYTEPAVTQSLLDNMSASGILNGYGIPEESCLVFENEKLSAVIGKPVYRVKLTDAAARRFSSTVMKSA